MRTERRRFVDCVDELQPIIDEVMLREEGGVIYIRGIRYDYFR